MNKSQSKKTVLLTIATVFLFALALIFPWFGSVQPQTKKSSAASASSNAVNIGNILVDGYAARQTNGDAGIFDAQTMNHLYELLTGIKDATWQDLVDYVNNTPASPPADDVGRSSDDFRTSVSKVLGVSKDI
ncbi:MAG: hypothetical protein K2H43_03315, partial [Clostridia bacterium]|nr:hypothetical protein [Clostridia bacterium]